VEAFLKFLSLSGSDIKLVMVGAGVREKIKNKPEFALYEDRIICPGFVPDDELNVLLSNSLAIVFPSLYEGFGMPLIEAMAAGVPVTCSNAGSIPEVVEDAGLYFDPLNIDEIANSIAKIVSDAKLRNELIQRGYRQAAKFSNTDAMIDEYIKLFEEVMKDGKSK
jgi:glycosyltransferase involved in cell wall biosynthesis